MHRKTITITKEMEAYIRARVDSGDYGNDSEYVRDLIRRDKARKEAEAELGRMIDKARAGGISDKSADDLIANFAAKQAVPAE